MEEQGLIRKTNIKALIILGIFSETISVIEQIRSDHFSIAISVQKIFIEVPIFE